MQAIKDESEVRSRKSEVEHYARSEVEHYARSEVEHYARSEVEHYACHPEERTPSTARGSDEGSRAS
jgi:hypothetical protein